MMPRLMERLTSLFSRSTSTNTARNAAGASSGGGVRRATPAVAMGGAGRSSDAPPSNAAVLGETKGGQGGAKGRSRHRGEEKSASKSNEDQAARLRAAVDQSGTATATATAGARSGGQSSGGTAVAEGNGGGQSANRDQHADSASGEGDVVTRTGSALDLLSSRRRDRHQQHQQQSEVPARSHEQLVNLIQRIDDHLNSQAERADRMLTLLERLPEALDAMPQIRKNGEHVVAVLERHMDAQRERDEQLRETMNGLGEGSRRQAEALTLIRDEIRAGQEREQQITNVLGDFRETLTNLGKTNEQSIEVLRRLSEHSKERESKLARILEKHSRILIVIAGAAVASSLAGLAVSIVAMINAGAG